MGLPSLLIALAIVTIGLLYTAWAIHRSHTHSRPRVVRATASVPVSAPPNWPLPLSPLTHHDPVTAAIDPPPAVRVFLAQKSITRGGEWQ